MLKDRQKTVLKATVLEHIKTAKPVASQDLLRRGFEVSPATLRNEMLALDDLGYLEQPHTSAGRMPTDQGYRFFVDNLLSEIDLADREKDLLYRTFSIKEADDFIKELSLVVAGISDTFAAVGALEEDLFYETGLSRILEEPELYDIEQARMFGRLADLLDESVRDMFQAKPSAEFNEVFIGKENPMREGEDFSMFVSTWQHPRGFQGFMTIVGPRRTNYSKHKALIESINKISHGR